jgi:hypothetical protein
VLIWLALPISTDSAGFVDFNYSNLKQNRRFFLSGLQETNFGWKFKLAALWSVIPECHLRQKHGLGVDYTYVASVRFECSF